MKLWIIIINVLKQSIDTDYIINYITLPTLIPFPTPLQSYVIHKKTPDL